MTTRRADYLFSIGVEDKKVLRSLCDAFSANKRMIALIGSSGQRFRSKLRIVIGYCYFLVKKLNGIFISSNASAYLLYYKNSERGAQLIDRMRYLYIALFIVGLRRLPEVYSREKLIRMIRQRALVTNGDRDYWHIWFLAQDKEEKSIKGLVEIKQYILQLSASTNLPVYIETTEERLLPVYRRVGFHFYAFESQERLGLSLWFGRLECR